MISLKSKIYVAGHKGLVGSAIVRELKKSGYKKIVVTNKNELNLSIQSDVQSFLKKLKPDFIFIAAAKAKGISYFKDISELNQKESPRLNLGSKILNMMGVKTELTKNSIKIYGQPNLKITKQVIIKDYLKDHRIFMMSTIAALTCGGQWKIHDKDSINTSFPSFLKIVKNISGKSL